MARGGRIYPDNKSQRALCRLIDDYADEALAKIIRDYLVEANEPDPKRDNTTLAKYRALVEEQLANLNDLLDGKNFLVTDQYTLADIAVFSSLKMLEIKGTEELISRYGELYRWYQNIDVRYQRG